MQYFIIEQSDSEFYTPNSGLALVGLALNRFTTLTSSLAKAVPSQDVISHGEVLKSYCGLLSEGKSDFVAVEQRRNDEFFHKALDNNHVPSEGTMRQRMDEHAEAFLPVASWASIEFLQNANVPVTALETGHVPVDIDGFVQDNSGSSKENVSYTYRNVDGYLVLPAYIGVEGWKVNSHLLPGSQHPQNGYLPFLRETHARIRQFCKKKLLYRKDSAHDSVDNLSLLQNPIQIFEYNALRYLTY